MAWGDNSNPVRFGYGQSVSDDRNLFLKTFGGEVIVAFQEKVYTLDKHFIQTIESGKSAAFPKTWKAESEYHQAGQEMLGNDIDTGEVTITIDGFVVAHTDIYDLDKKMAHFEVTGEFSTELGRALARAFDKNVYRAIILAARKAADGPFPGGNVITDAALVNSGSIDGKAWVDAIRQMNINMFNKDVPEEMERWMAVNAEVFDAIKYAKDANGNYVVLNRELNPSGSNAGAIAGRVSELEVDGVKVAKIRTLPNSNETAAVKVYPKYRANYATTTGVLWCKHAVGTVKLLDVALETERDARRQSDFMVSKMAVGTDPLRPECAGEFKTA